MLSFQKYKKNMKKNKPKQSSPSSFLAVATKKQNQTLNEENVSDRKITANVSSTTCMILCFINTMVDGKSSTITFVSVFFSNLSESLWMS